MDASASLESFEGRNASTKGHFKVVEIFSTSTFKRVSMRKILFIVLASFYAITSFAASGEKSSSATSSEKDTAVIVKDEKADNAKDKEVVKKASPEARKNAKEEAEKTKAKTGKDGTKY